MSLDTVPTNIRSIDSALVVKEKAILENISMYKHRLDSLRVISDSLDVEIKKLDKKAFEVIKELK